MTTPPDVDDAEFLSDESLSALNLQQGLLYVDRWTNLVEYLRTEGKNPKRNVGLSESSLRPTLRRIHQVHQHQWTRGPIVLELGTSHADDFVRALNTDEYLTNAGNPYAEGSKRKFIDALQMYFGFCGIEWVPDINFGNSDDGDSADPFNRSERDLLRNAATTYMSPPGYGNVSPEERERWNRTIAEYIGVSMESVGPDDWEILRRHWKIPSMVSAALDLGMRAALVYRSDTEHVDLDGGRFVIPGEVAVKNDQRWKPEIKDRTTMMMDRWLDQRANIPKYDGRDAIWLNREGNRYTSRNLNDLLDNLIDEAGIEVGGRHLTWHSIRHSTGMYVFDETESLEMVAETLRHASLEAAREYAHPTPESKQNVIESL